MALATLHGTGLEVRPVPTLPATLPLTTPAPTPDPNEGLLIPPSLPLTTPYPMLDPNEAAQYHGEKAVASVSRAVYAASNSVKAAQEMIMRMVNLSPWVQIS